MEDETSVQAVKLPEHVRDLENLTVFPADTEPAHEIQLVRENTFGSSDRLLIGRMGNVDDDNQIYKKQLV